MNPFLCFTEFFRENRGSDCGNWHGLDTYLGPKSVVRLPNRCHITDISLLKPPANVAISNRFQLHFAISILMRTIYDDINNGISVTRLELSSYEMIATSVRQREDIDGSYFVDSLFGLSLFGNYSTTVHLFSKSSFQFSVSFFLKLNLNFGSFVFVCLITNWNN